MARPKPSLSVSSGRPSHERSSHSSRRYNREHYTAKLQQLRNQTPISPQKLATKSPHPKLTPQKLMTAAKSTVAGFKYKGKVSMLPRPILCKKKAMEFLKGPQTSVRRECFREALKHVVQEVDAGFSFHTQALLALQEATEVFVAGLNEEANLCALHSKRVTLRTRDLDLVRRIRGELD